MHFVQWQSGAIVGRVHLASDRLRTLCGRPIPDTATQSNKAPRDKTKFCKRCRTVADYERRNQHVFEE